MQWLITYTTDNGTSEHQQTISAATYTQAYINFSIGNNFIILDIKKI